MHRVWLHEGHDGDRPTLQRVDHGFGEEWWSVRKALRRLVSHELGHGKSVRRILGDYARWR